VNPFARLPLNVALLGSDRFDVAEVDASTLVFGPADALAHRVWGHRRSLDTNDDGFDDLISV
jgi:hypothetical protein